MPPSWGRSGARATPKVRVEFAADGLLLLKETGAYDGRVVRWESVGSWSTAAESVRSIWNRTTVLGKYIRLRSGLKSPSEEASSRHTRFDSENVAFLSCESCETNTRVRLRETEATLRSVQRIRRAGEHQSTRAPAVAGGRPEPVVANNQRDDDEENDANEVMLDEIDARLRSLQDFLTRTKARDESRRPSDSLID